MLLFLAGLGQGGAHTAWLSDMTDSRRHGGPRTPPLLGVQEVSSLVGGGKREHSRPLASGWGRGGTSAQAQVCFAARMQLCTHAPGVTHP